MTKPPPNTAQLLATLLITITQASHAHAGTPAECEVPCPNGYTEISMELIAQDRMKYGPTGMKQPFQDPNEMASDLRDLMPDQMKARLKNKDINGVVLDPGSIRGAILNAAAACKRIKYLGIFSHGTPGRLGIADHNKASSKGQAIDSENAYQIFNGLDCAMAPDSSVMLFACNVTSGCGGEDFERVIANNLLKKGGNVRGPSFYSSRIPGYGLASMTGSWQGVTVGKNFSSPRWEREPSSRQECRKNAQDDEKKLRELISAYGSCNKTIAQIAANSWSLAEGDKRPSLNEDTPLDRRGVSNEYYDSAKHYSRDIARVQNAIRDISDSLDSEGCPGGKRSAGGSGAGVAK